MLESMMNMLNIAQNSELVAMQKENMELQKALFYTSLSAFEGEMVEHSGEVFDYQDQDQEIIMNIPAKVDRALLNIFDESKRLVKSIELDKKEGRNSFVWDGKMEDGEYAPKGIYSVYVTATDESDEPVEVKTRLKSIITDIAYDENELALPLSGRIPIYDIKRRTMIHKATERYKEVSEKSSKNYQDAYSQTTNDTSADMNTQTPLNSAEGLSLSDTNFSTL